MWNNSRLMGWTVCLLHDDTGSKSPNCEMDLLNFLDLWCGTLKGGRGGSLFLRQPGHFVNMRTKHDQ